MPCYKPYTAYRSKNGKLSTGKHPIVFKKTDGIPKSDLQIACGQCYGCRLERSKIWAMRCMHEAKMHTHNQYLTLTYNDEELSKIDEMGSPGSLHSPHLTNFWKRLRKHKHKFRYYACGEYGDKSYRPHYHAIAFGLYLSDRIPYKQHNGNQLYTSETLNKIWGHGYVVIGNVTFESCAYVARYVMKKRNGSDFEKEQLYGRFNPSTGHIWEVESEFQTASRGGKIGDPNRGGIGSQFYRKYKNDMYQSGTDGQCIIRGGVASKPPIFYESKYESESKEQFDQVEKIKQRRRENYEARADDNTPARLKTKEAIAKRKAQILIRPTI